MNSGGFILVIVGVMLLWLGITGRFEAVMLALKGAVKGETATP